jgi:hypothetical protein
MKNDLIGNFQVDLGVDFNFLICNGANCQGHVFNLVIILTPKIKLVLLEAPLFNLRVNFPQCYQSSSMQFQTSHGFNRPLERGFIDRDTF